MSAPVHGMTLGAMADSVKAGELTYEAVANEYARRVAAGLSPDTGRELEPSPPPATTAVCTCASCKLHRRHPIEAAK